MALTVNRKTHDADNTPDLRSGLHRLQLQQSTQEGIVPLLLQSGSLAVRYRRSDGCTHRPHTKDTPKASIMTSLRGTNAINKDYPHIIQ